jgi:oligoendopeptidase F
MPVTHRIAHLKRPSKEFPRRFVAGKIDFSSWTNLKPHYTKLLKRKLDSAAAVEKWLLDMSEVGSIVSEEGSRRYIAMTCATDDKKAEKAYLHFVEKIEPKLKPIGHELNIRLVECPHTQELNQKRYRVMLRSVRNHVELFRPENVPLETEVDKLAQQYQKIIGGMMVNFKGREYTFQQMGVFAQAPDRPTRKEAFNAGNERRMREVEKLDELYDRMLKLRNQMAKNAGFDNYRDYQFRRYDRFDYTPDDCFRYHEAVEKHCVPVGRKAIADRKKSLKLDTVRLWDTACDRFGRPPLHPFKTTKQLAEGCRKIFSKVDQRLGKQFQQMIDMGLLDLDSRKGKAPGGYQTTLSEVRLPFIFMNAVGLNHDVFTLLHEGGHAFHQFAARNEPLLGYRHSPMEFAEVASMSMEKLGAPYLEVFYTPGDAARARRNSLEGDIAIMPWIAIVDAFQHWIYTHPNHTSEERSEFFMQLSQRYHSGVDWTGYEDSVRTRWQMQLHIFEYPFYYIEYGIALLGALQVWRNSRQDIKGAVDAYLQALSLGGTVTLPELFKSANTKFDFSEKTIKPLMGDVLTEMEKEGKKESR